MHSLAMSLIVQASLLGAGEADYASAYQQQQTTGHPLVVLIGADWCPGCRTMKTAVMPELQRRGALNSVHYSVVNIDRERDLAQKMMEGGSIPQLIVYRHTAAGWQRSRMLGAHSAAEIEAFIGHDSEMKSASAIKVKPAAE